MDIKVFAFAATAAKARYRIAYFCLLSLSAFP
jgi:hypothetical protein